MYVLISFHLIVVAFNSPQNFLFINVWPNRIRSTICVLTNATQKNADTQYVWPKIKIWEKKIQKPRNERGWKWEFVHFLCAITITLPVSVFLFVLFVNMIHHAGTHTRFHLIDRLWYQRPSWALTHRSLKMNNKKKPKKSSFENAHDDVAVTLKSCVEKISKKKTNHMRNSMRRRKKRTVLLLYLSIVDNWL